MARLILLKKHPFNPETPDFVPVNPHHITSMKPLGDDATVVYIGLGCVNVAYPMDEVFYLINNDGEVVGP